MPKNGDARLHLTTNHFIFNTMESLEIHFNCEQLSKPRFGEEDALGILHYLQETKSFASFAEYLFDADNKVSRNAAWVLTKATDNELMELMPLYNRLIDLVLSTENTSLRRLTLNILERLPMTEDSLRTDFLDFCLEHMLSLDEPPGVQSLCMKLSYLMCRFYPELMDELNRSLEMMDTSFYKPAVICIRRRILAGKYR